MLIYFKSTLVGVVTVLAGCVVTPFFILMRMRLMMMRKSAVGAVAIGFNPIQLMHTVGFWVFVLVMFSVGFVLSAVFLRR